MIGSVLSNRYEILREIGRGGMGVVYLARDPALSREVAIKVIPPTLLSPEAEARFRREARLVAQMDHPGIVGVYDTGDHEGSLYLVMPFVRGTNLRSLMNDGSLSLGDVIDIGIQVAEALEYSHSNGVVHRDIKPENILVVRQEPHGLRLRITDFGLAMASTESRLTKTGALVGTISYLSPEQITDVEVDGRADLYALGTLLYECMVGKAPFSGEIQSVLYRIAHELPEPPRALGSEIREELELIVMQCLEKNPATRPQHAKEVAEALARHRTKLKENESAQRISVTHRSTTQAQRPVIHPFVGREKEQAELQRRLNAALQGECQFVVVSGEVGLGKSRLLDEIESLARARKIRIQHGRFVERDQAFPYQGFCDMILEFFRQKATSSSPFDFSDLATDLVSLFPMLREIEEVRSSLANPSPSSPPAPKRLEDRIAVFELIAGTLIRMAEGKPLVLVFEDLHAADVSVDALQYMVRRLGPTPTLILATYRTTEVAKKHPLLRMLESFQGDRRFALIRLEPLWPTEHRAFLEMLIGSQDLERDFVEKMYEATEGNPYFTKELVRSLMDSGRIIKTDTGSWSLSGETAISTESLPETIHQTVERRIERLPKNLRELLSIASVVGRTFELKDILTLSRKKERVEDDLEGLIQEGFIEEVRQAATEQYAFSSGVVHEVLYAGLSKPRRKALHRNFAEQLEKRYAGRLERFYAPLLHHYSLGNVPVKVIEFGLKLAGNSLDTFYAEDAIRACKAVLDCLRDEDIGDPIREGETHGLLARAYRMIGNTDAALRELEQAAKAFRQANDSSRVVSAIASGAETAWEGQKMEEAKRWVEQGLRMARTTGDPADLSRLLTLGATLANLRGEYEKAREYLQENEQTQPARKESVESIPTGGNLMVALPLSIPIKHPALIDLNAAWEVFANCFETLVTTDDAGNLIPCLCERWHTQDQGKSFLFHLRKNVVLHDGQPLTSQVIQQSFEKAISVTRNRLPAVLAAIRGVRDYLAGSSKHVAGLIPLAEDQLEIQLEEPLPIYPAMLTDFTHSSILLDATPEGSDERRLVGTGPFQINRLEPDTVVLQKNPGYWRGKTPPLDSIEFRATLSAAGIADRFRAGEFDVARDLVPEDLDDILRDRRLKATLVEVPRKNAYFILFNKSNAPARNPMLRWAMGGLVRVHDLVRATIGRFAQPAEGLFPPGILGHDPGRRRNTLSRERALKLLESSYLPLPIRLKAAVHPIMLDRFASLTGALFKVWADIGIEVTNETPSANTFFELIEKGNEEISLMIMRGIPSYDDPDDLIYGLFHSESGMCRHFYSSAEIDRQIHEARLESNQSARAKLYQKMETLFLETGFFLPLFHEVDYRVAGPRVKGIVLRSNAPYVNYSELGKMETAGPAVRKKGGGIIHVPVPEEISDLDPSFVNLVSQAEVISMVFETLTRESEARIIPWLVSEFHAEKGGRRFRFHLREEARFHDGRRVGSRDVRYSFEHLLLNSQSAYRWLLSPIRGARDLIAGKERTLSGFEILSASEFTIELDEPVSFFPALLAHASAAIIPEGAGQFTADWKQGCVGNGPFRVLRFEPRSRLELERNPFYWRQGFPRCDGLTFTFGVPPADALAGLRNGKFSLSLDLAPSDVEALRRDSDFASLYRDIPRLQTSLIVFNIRQGPLANEELRHALIQAVNVEHLVLRHFGRLAIPATGLIPPGLVGYEPVPVTAARVRGERRPEKVELTGLATTMFEKSYAAVTTELLGVFEQAGFRTEIPWKIGSEEWEKARTSGGTDFFLLGWNADYPDADSFIHGLLHSEKGFIGRFCGTPEIDRLIERGRTETNLEIRHDIYREVEEIIARRALLLPLFYLKLYGFARPEVEGFELSFSQPFVAYDKLWIRR